MLLIMEDSAQNLMLSHKLQFTLSQLLLLMLLFQLAQLKSSLEPLQPQLLKLLKLWKLVLLMLMLMPKPELGTFLFPGRSVESSHLLQLWAILLLPSQLRLPWLTAQYTIPQHTPQLSTTQLHTVLTDTAVPSITQRLMLVWLQFQPMPPLHQSRPTLKSSTTLDMPSHTASIKNFPFLSSTWPFYKE